MLTNCQLEYLALYASGDNTCRIAKVKYLAPSSVRNTLKNAQHRLGARSLTHCVALAFSYGLLEAGPDGSVTSTKISTQRVV